MRGVERWTKWLSAASLAALVSACAGVPHDASLPIDDPNEQFNRGVLHVNQVVLDPRGDRRQVGARGDPGPLPGFGREPERAACLRQ